MASLYKPKYTSKDPKTGKPIRKSAKKWYGQYRDVHGDLKRVPLCTDKAAAQAMLNEIIKKEQWVHAGLSDPKESFALMPLKEHLDDYKAYLAGKGCSEKHTEQTIKRIQTLIDGCGFKRVVDLNATKVVNWLADQRKTTERFSNRTSNFYQDAAKTFCAWLEANERIYKNPLRHLQRINVDTDKRHERRALLPEELEKLVKAAQKGPVVEGMLGPDRAMLYILAAWTGFRRGELASLTLRSFSLDTESPIVTVQAGYSKRRKKDIIPLHPTVVESFREWVATKPDLGPDSILFILKTRKDYFRDTAKMMTKDLEQARNAWIEEAKTAEEVARREASDFLKYCNSDGLYADFHSNRHTFISNLTRAGVAPQVAKQLARHSDINLTMNTYTHIELEQQATALKSLPSVPSVQADNEKLCLMLTLDSDYSCPDVSSGVQTPPASESTHTSPEPLKNKTPDDFCHLESFIVGVHP